MKRLLLVILLLGGIGARAAEKSSDVSQLYLQAYVDQQKGHESAQKGDLVAATKSFQEAAKILADIQHRFPDWQPAVVSYRQEAVAKALQNPQAVPASSATPLSPEIQEIRQDAKQTSGLVGNVISLVLYSVISFAVWKYYRRQQLLLVMKYQTFAPRFWTGLVDALVLWPLSLAISLLGNLPPVGMMIVLMVSNLGWLVYSIVMHGRCGQTVGKMVTKIKVVDHRTETQISWRQAILRDGVPLLFYVMPLYAQISLLWPQPEGTVMDPKNLAGKISSLLLLSMLPMLWLGIELLTMFTNAKRRALHDFIAGTVVIRTNVEPLENE